MATDITSLAPTAAFADNTHVNFDVRLRLPHDSKYNVLSGLRISPYAFLGVGHGFSGSGWDSHTGLGLEFKANDHINIFSDVRYTFANDHFLNTGGDSSAGVRAGLRFRF